VIRASHNRSEDPALKARALERARAVLEQDRISGIGFRLPQAIRSAFLRRRTRTTLPLIAAAALVAGLAAASVGVYAFQRKPAPALPNLAVPSLRQAAPVARPATRGAPRTVTVTEAAAPAPSVSASPALPKLVDGARSVGARQYQSELALLEPARTSIARGEFGAALTALGKHRREFPNGELAQEREALRVRALWGVGQKGAASAAAKAFRKRYPRSVLLGWLKDQGEEAP
jgi:hypothetical protein